MSGITSLPAQIKANTLILQIVLMLLKVWFQDMFSLYPPTRRLGMPSCQVTHPRTKFLTKFFSQKPSNQATQQPLVVLFSPLAAQTVLNLSLNSVMSFTRRTWHTLLAPDHFLQLPLQIPCAQSLLSVLPSWKLRK